MNETATKILKAIIEHVNAHGTKFERADLGIDFDDDENAMAYFFLVDNGYVKETFPWKVGKPTKGIIITITDKALNATI